jgi:hypothetical protein
MQDNFFYIRVNGRALLGKRKGFHQQRFGNRGIEIHDVKLDEIPVSFVSYAIEPFYDRIRAAPLLDVRYRS